MRCCCCFPLHLSLAGYSSLGKSTAAARAALPIPNGACGIFVCPNKRMATNAWDFFFLYVRTDVNLWDYTRGLYGRRKRVCTISCLWDKNVLPAPTNRPASAACRSDALLTELHLRCEIRPTIYLTCCCFMASSYVLTVSLRKAWRHPSLPQVSNKFFDICWQISCCCFPSLCTEADKMPTLAIVSRAVHTRSNTSTMAPSRGIGPAETRALSTCMSPVRNCLRLQRKRGEQIHWRVCVREREMCVREREMCVREREREREREWERERERERVCNYGVRVCVRACVLKCRCGCMCVCVRACVYDCMCMIAMCACACMCLYDCMCLWLWCGVCVRVCVWCGVCVCVVQFQC